jgi:LAO/AO transport system kinase
LINSIEYWIDRFFQKDIVALSKILKEVENETTMGMEFIQHPKLQNSKAHIIGITGPPGAGKSTLVGKLTKLIAELGLSVGIICIDPTSPFTQGALLGDRVRMNELAKLNNIFIKSLATRGNLGGLTNSTSDLIQVFSAFGKDIVLIETVGVGQAEFEILNTADSVVLLNVPGLGDTVQTLKAGIMEIADIYVINQADRPGADESVKDLKMMLRESKKSDWVPPIVKSVATQNEGIQDILYAIQKHEYYLKSTNLWDEKRVSRRYKRLIEVTKNEFIKKLEEKIHTNSLYINIVKDLEEGKVHPVYASLIILKDMKITFEEGLNDKN